MRQRTDASQGERTELQAPTGHDPSNALNQRRHQHILGITLWGASGLLLATGAILLWGARVEGSFDAGPAATFTIDSDSGRIDDCISEDSPCPRALATTSLGYALSLPMLTAGATGLLLGAAVHVLQAPTHPPRSPLATATAAHAQTPTSHAPFMPPTPPERPRGT